MYIHCVIIIQYCEIHNTHMLEETRKPFRPENLVALYLLSGFQSNLVFLTLHFRVPSSDLTPLCPACRCLESVAAT